MPTKPSDAYSILNLLSDLIDRTKSHLYKAEESTILEGEMWGTLKCEFDAMIQLAIAARTMAAAEANERRMNANAKTLSV